MVSRLPLPMTRAEVFEGREMVEGFVKLIVAALIVTELPLAPPRVVLPVTARVPLIVVRPEPGLRTILPLDAEPSVRVCALVVVIVPSPVSERALLPVPETEAVGVPPALFMKANFALVVAFPPTSRSF